MGERELAIKAVVDNRANAYNLTQKIAGLSELIQMREKIESDIIAEQERKDVLEEQREDLNRQIKECNRTIKNDHKRKYQDTEQAVNEQTIDPWPDVSDLSMVTFANNLCPTNQPIDNRAAAIIRINAKINDTSHSSSSIDSDESKKPASTSSSGPSSIDSDESKKPASTSSSSTSSSSTSSSGPSSIDSDEPKKPANPTSEMDGESMSDGEVDDALLQPVLKFHIARTGSEDNDSPRSRASSVASANTAALNDYDGENTT